MAKKSNSTPKTPNNSQPPVCPDSWKTIKTSNPKKKALYIQWNAGNGGTFSIKAIRCGQRTPNVGWLKNGWLSFKIDQINNQAFIYLIGEINATLEDNITKWNCWEDSLLGKTKFDGGTGYQGHLHFGSDAEALCFLSKFYRLHSCPENPAEKKALIEKPC
jgi:hypothetical protein